MPPRVLVALPDGFLDRARLVTSCTSGGGLLGQCVRFAVSVIPGGRLSMRELGSVRVR